VVFESLYAAVNLKRPLETAMLARISAIIPWLLIAYLVLRIGEIVLSGEAGLFLAGGAEPWLFAAEMALFLIGIVMLLDKSRRCRPTTLFLAATAVLLGGALYRFNAFLIAFDPGPGWHYFPGFGELMITVGIVAFEVMAYLFFVKKTPVLIAGHPPEDPVCEQARRKHKPATGLPAGAHPA
jgi:Ni/Fe-hydrogenase subunit HybB-like protein